MKRLYDYFFENLIHLPICSMGLEYLPTFTPPKFNIDPEKLWLEDDPFLLGR